MRFYHLFFPFPYSNSTEKREKGNLQTSLYFSQDLSSRLDKFFFHSFTWFTNIPIITSASCLLLFILILLCFLYAARKRQRCKKKRKENLLELCVCIIVMEWEEERAIHKQICHSMELNKFPLNWIHRVFYERKYSSRLYAQGALVYIVMSCVRNEIVKLFLRRSATSRMNKLLLLSYTNMTFLFSVE